MQLKWQEREAWRGNKSARAGTNERGWAREGGISKWQENRAVDPEIRMHVDKIWWRPLT